MFSFGCLVIAESSLRQGCPAGWPEVPAGHSLALTAVAAANLLIQTMFSDICSCCYWDHPVEPGTGTADAVHLTQIPGVCVDHAVLLAYDGWLHALAAVLPPLVVVSGLLATASCELF